MADRKYTGKDYVSDIIRGMASGLGAKTVPMYQALAADLPEGAGASPEIFQAMMGQKKLAMGAEDRDRALDIKEAALGIREESNRLAGERDKATASYRDKLLGLRKDALGMQARRIAQQDENLRSLENVARDIFKIKPEDRTESDNMMLNSYKYHLVQSGALGLEDMEFVDDEDFLQKYVITPIKKAVGGAGGTGGTGGAGREKIIPAGAKLLDSMGKEFTLNTATPESVILKKKYRVK